MSEFSNKRTDSTPRAPKDSLCQPDDITDTRAVSNPLIRDDSITETPNDSISQRLSTLSISPNDGLPNFDPSPNPFTSSRSRQSAPVSISINDNTSIPSTFITSTPSITSPPGPIASIISPPGPTPSITSVAAPPAPISSITSVAAPPGPTPSITSVTSAPDPVISSKRRFCISLPTLSARDSSLLARIVWDIVSSNNDSHRYLSFHYPSLCFCASLSVVCASVRLSVFVLLCVCQCCLACLYYL